MSYNCNHLAHRHQPKELDRYLQGMQEDSPLEPSRTYQTVGWTTTPRPRPKNLLARMISSFFPSVCSHLETAAAEGASPKIPGTVHHLKIIPPEPASERSIQAISSQPICDLLNLQMGITRLCWTKGRSTRLESNFSCQNIGLIHGFWILTPSQFDSHLQGAQMACGSDGLMRRSLPSQCERHRWSEEHRHNRDKVREERSEHIYEPNPQDLVRDCGDTWKVKEPRMTLQFLAGMQGGNLCIV
uniref:Uncharacterized protein LOC109549456 isoform X1 n=2 Tax=Tursiops truncatus TaxID=9739 RepID=A0A6J3Q9N0_TURTR|nr:uncharacterized protein LOC109549456 isoform X1 [Tursiops truncatus]XP_033698949.1 uncharacterized protein LOC109549456 isoform X1 [Tursiops truncatus]